MRSQVMTQKRSSQGEKSILVNELVRRFEVIDDKIKLKEQVEIIAHFTTQLKNSGYDYKQSREIMICALKGITRKRVVKKHWKIEYRRNYSKQVPGLKRK